MLKTNLMNDIPIIFTENEKGDNKLEIYIRQLNVFKCSNIDTDFLNKLIDKCNESEIKHAFKIVRMFILLLYY